MFFARAQIDRLARRDGCSDALLAADLSRAVQNGQDLRQVARRVTNDSPARGESKDRRLSGRPGFEGACQRRDRILRRMAKSFANSAPMRSGR